MKATEKNSIMTEGGQICRIGEISNARLRNFIKNDDASKIKIPHTSVWNLGGDEVIRADTRTTYRESNTLGKTTTSKTTRKAAVD